MLQREGAPPGVGARSRMPGLLAGTCEADEVIKLPLLTDDEGVEGRMAVNGSVPSNTKLLEPKRDTEIGRAQYV